MARKKMGKRQYKEWLDENATKILCRYCNLREECKLRERKEKTEQEGIITYCVLTPNKKKKKQGWKKYNKNGEVININRHGIPVNKSLGEENRQDKKKQKRYNSKYRKNTKMKRRDTDAN